MRTAILNIRLSRATNLKLLSSLILLSACISTETHAQEKLSLEKIKTALKVESLTPSEQTIESLRSDFTVAHNDHCQFLRTGNSKVSFSAVQIAEKLGLNPKVDATAITRIKKTLAAIPCPQIRKCGTRDENETCPNRSLCRVPDNQKLDWEKYFNKTINLSSETRFSQLLSAKSFYPVKISWEDIGRFEGSVWGDRISDVGIWVRKNEVDSDSAELALSVRRDSNFRDKILVVPSEKIKIHKSVEGHTTEVTLPERLKELGLTSSTHDKNVIVSNQFAVVPVPAQSSDTSHPARAAFNFSIFPYGSTNYVITDVIEGSSDAIVGPGTHQLLYSNVEGKKAPFTASRASERQDLLELERNLKSKGMDVDVQRYYLIQIPLKKDATGIELSNMGTPPIPRTMNFLGSAGSGEMPAMSPLSADSSTLEQSAAKPVARSKAKGFEKVAIGHGETEGEYNSGAGFEGKRSDEPVRVTVVYFVTPVGEVTQDDMTSFTNAFESWDSQAIWGGSFVTKDNS